MPRKKPIPRLVTPKDFHREFMTIFEGFDRSRTRWQIFGDFVELAACAVSNSCDPWRYAEREARYLEVIKPYATSEDRHRFGRLLGVAKLAHMKVGPHDFWGEIFGPAGLDLGSKHLGQIFTPYEVSHMMARMTLHDAKAIVQAEGFITLMEPASGAGSMIAAVAQTLEEDELDYRQVLHVTAVDLDRRCTHMTYLTCALLDIPATVWCGNSLDDPAKLRDPWLTPAHVRGRWGAKLAERDKRDQTRALQLEIDKSPLFALEAPQPAEIPAT